jgi:predicted nucleic acid-binding OB-fold protein
MTQKVDRLQLIRERHRKVILEPRKKVEFDIFDDWSEEVDFIDEELLTRQLRDRGDED